MNKPVSSIEDGGSQDCLKGRHGFIGWVFATTGSVAAGLALSVFGSAGQPLWSRLKYLNNFLWIGIKWVQTVMIPRGIHSTDFGDPITFPVGSH